MNSYINNFGSLKLIIIILILFFLFSLIIKFRNNLKRENPLDSDPDISQEIEPGNETLVNPAGRVTEKNQFEELNEDEISNVLNDSGKFGFVPEIAKKKNDQGVEAFNRGDIEKATALYKEATEIAPHFNLALYNLGNVYISKNQYDKAIETYEKVIMHSPKDEFAYYNLAMAYYKKGELRTATIYYRKAIEISPGDPAIHYNLGKIYEQLNSYDQAEKAYNTAISLRPDYANAHYNLAEVLRQKGRYQMAIKEYELYLKYNPEAEDQVEVKNIIIRLLTR